MTISDDPNKERFILIDAEPYDVVGTATTHKYFGTRAFITEPADTPASVDFQDYIDKNGAFTITRSIYSSSKIGGRSFPSAGAIKLINPLAPDDAAGDLDTWIDDAALTWDGRDFTAYMLEIGDDWADRTQIFKGVFEDLNWSRDNLFFTVKDRQHLLDKLIQSAFYTGAGGNEGGAELEGKPKPLAFGRLFNISAVMVNFATFLMQVHHGTIEEISEIRDKGVPLITTGTASAGAAGSITLNAASTSGYEAIDPNTLGNGYYTGCQVSITSGTGSGQTRTASGFTAATRVLTVSSNWTTPPDATSVYRVEEWTEDLANGRFTLLAKPDGLVTCDVKGSTLSGTYSGKCGDLMSYIVQTYGGFASGDVDSASITALNTTNSAEVGYYTYINPTNILDCLDFLADSIGAFFGTNRSGDFFVGRFEAPATSSLDIAMADIRKDSIDREQFYAPVWRTIYNYRKNWSPQDPSSLATSVPADKQALYAKEYLTTQTSTAAVQTKHKGAVELVLYSGMYDDTAADTERDRLHALYGVRRSIFTFETFVLPFSIDLNATINVTHDRLGLAAGEDMVVVQTEEDGLSGLVKVRAFA